MDLPLSRLAAPRLVALDTVGSTNDELTRRAAGDPSSWPDGSVVVTLDQTAGRGRRGRVWVAPPGRALAVSVLCAPADAALDPGWLPLMAGLALVETLRGVVPAPAAVTLKWPNDVQLDGRKVSGILGEPRVARPVRARDGPQPHVRGARAAHGHVHVPAPRGGRRAGRGRDPRGVPRFVRRAPRRVERAGGDARGAGLVEELARTCATIGRDVRVELPGGGEAPRAGDGGGRPRAAHRGVRRGSGRDVCRRRGRDASAVSMRHGAHG
ncbi:biotin--[acetyl-CoA-carboxylase] ligase [Clavibacter tessellarius]|uniref:biotin--[acetyl-CoA-carboxylase] ligase n=1 Tax=Clavibacter tessellarius TaxID=31965 RepID=UPI00324897BE